MQTFDESFHSVTLKCFESAKDNSVACLTTRRPSVFPSPSKYHYSLALWTTTVLRMGALLSLPLLAIPSVGTVSPRLGAVSASIS
jgi:hypothetical protein